VPAALPTWLARRKAREGRASARRNDPVDLEEGKGQESSGSSQGVTPLQRVTDARPEQSSEARVKTKVERRRSDPERAGEQRPPRGGTAGRAGEALKVEKPVGESGVKHHHEVSVG